MGNFHSKAEEINLFSSWLKKWNNEKRERGDIYGLIDVTKLTWPRYIDDPASMVEQKHERRRRDCGEIVIDEEVPQKIINLLKKLSFIESDDVISNVGFLHDFDSYYEERGFAPTLFGVSISGEESRDFTGVPIVLLLDFITVKKRLHVRSKDVKDFCRGFDSYLQTLRRIEYCQSKKYKHFYNDFNYKQKLPITKEEIHSIIKFFYEVLDKNNLSKYKEDNTDLDDVAINQCLV